MKLVAALITVFAATSVYASHANNTKKLQVPFVHQAINSVDYKGLTFTYNMGNPAQKVVCTLSYFYKGWMEYPENTQVKTSGTYGGSQTVILTSLGSSSEISETLDQFHADAAGEVTIQNLEYQSSAPAFASCFYAPDMAQLQR